jgi:hypothetical protein
MEQFAQSLSEIMQENPVNIDNIVPLQDKVVIEVVYKDPYKDGSYDESIVGKLWEYGRILSVWKPETNAQFESVENSLKNFDKPVCNFERGDIVSFPISNVQVIPDNDNKRHAVICYYFDLGSELKIC